MTCASVHPKIDLLVVEDSRLIRERIVAQLGELEEVGSTVETDDVLSTLGMLKTRRFDAVLLDVHLADGNGLAVLKEIRKHSLTPAVIVFTTQASPQMRMACLHLGANYFCDKGKGFEPVEEALRQIAARPAADESSVHPA
jgi:two-component system OmpR family response regulator